MDLESILYCFERTLEKNDDFNLTALFIISERFFGYPFFRDIDNFDARSSIFVIGFLRDLGVIQLEENLNLDFPRLEEGIKTLLTWINDTEKKGSFLDSKKERKTFLKSTYSEKIDSYKQEKLFFTNKR